MKRFLSLVLLLAILLALPSCQSGKTRYQAQFLELFDTMTQIVASADSKEQFTEFSQFIYDTLAEYHKLYDIYHDYEGISNVKTINDNAGKAPVKVDRRIIDLLLFAKEKFTETGGKCNVAMGSVLKIWHTYREEGIDDPDNAKVPPMSDLIAASKHTDINKVIIDEAASTVYLSDPLMSLDVGAVAKGYATEQVCQAAEKKGTTSALVSVGGNVRAIGSKDGKDEPWLVGVQNPDLSSDQDLLLTAKVINKSVVTSGIYERYYTVDDVNYHHIIDPVTLMPARFFQSVTILTHDSGLADVLSTAIFCLSYEDGLKVIRSLPDTEALWVLPDGTLKYSDNFQAYIEKK